MQNAWTKPKRASKLRSHFGVDRRFERLFDFDGPIDRSIAGWMISNPIKIKLFRKFQKVCGVLSHFWRLMFVFCTVCLQNSMSRGITKLCNSDATNRRTLYSFTKSYFSHLFRELRLHRMQFSDNCDSDKSSLCNPVPREIRERCLLWQPFVYKTQVFDFENRRHVKMWRMILWCRKRSPYLELWIHRGQRRHG